MLESKINMNHTFQIPSIPEPAKIKQINILPEDGVMEILTKVVEETNELIDLMKRGR